MCGEQFTARAGASTCSPRCRQRQARRARGNEDAIQRMITAHHEASHAVAAAIHGRRVYHIDINGDGKHAGRSVSETDAFTAFAGAWAEVRLDRAADSRVFRELVMNSLKYDQPYDHKLMRAELKATREKLDWATWHRDLEMHWPITQRVAALLLAGVHDVESMIPGMIGSPEFRSPPTGGR